MPEESNVTSWFDGQSRDLVSSQYEATEPEWLSAPDQSERHAQSAAPSLEGPTGSVFAEGPVTEFDLPHSELELDILIGRLAGTQLGDDTSLMSWFDAQLPGAAALTEAEPAVEMAPLRDAPIDDHNVGGWLVEGNEGSSDAYAVDHSWETAVAPEEGRGSMNAAPQGPDATARHSIDPLAGSEGSNGRPWGRKHGENGAENSGSVEVPARPSGRLLLPGTPKRDT
jgi:hypothetical protein